MSGWGSCTTCANTTGAADYSMQQGISSPSESGSAIKFTINGGNPFVSALWWKQVGGNDSAKNFVFELDYYVGDPSAAWALEFNVNQNASGRRYEYATQCDIAARDVGTWRVWDNVDFTWIDSGKPCPAPAANSWNHLVWEFQRNDSNQVVFQAVTLNGVREDVNITQGSVADSGSGIDVAYQMDTNRFPNAYTTYVDNVKLTYW